MTIASFLRDCRANTAVSFAIALLPIVGATAVAIDYGGVIKVRRQLQDAADAAALAVAADISATSLADAKTADYKAKAKTVVTANLGSAISATLDDFRVCATAGGDCRAKDGTALTAGQVYVHLSATAPRTMSKVLPVKIGGTTDSIPTSATATATASGSAAAYTDIYIVVDVSASMGLGASPADQKKMQEYMGCAFACHTVDPYIPWSQSNDSVITAHNLGVSLRIDAVKAALKNMATKAQASGPVVFTVA